MQIGIDLQACQSSGNRARGIGRYAMSLARAMAASGRGHDFRLILNGGFHDTLPPIRRALEALPSIFDILSLDLPARVAENVPGNRPRARAAEMLREALIAGSAPDVVHVSSLFEGWIDDVVTSVGAVEGAPATAVTLFDLIPLARQDRYLADPAARDWYMRKVESLRRAGMIFAPSEATRRDAIDLLGISGDRVHVIGGAADPQFMPLAAAPDLRTEPLRRLGITRPFVLYTGGIEYRKNVQALVDAFALLPQPVRSAHQLVVVCAISGDERRRLLGHAARVGLSPDAVVLPGYVPDNDLVALYGTCALFVFPSLLEGFGLPVLEAMACGAAVIGSNTSSIPEVIGRSDALFDPGRPEHIAAAMNKALGEPDFLASLRGHAHVQSARFSWPDTATRALQALEELHARSSRRPLVSAANPPAHRAPAAAAEVTAAPNALLALSRDLAADLDRQIESVAAGTRTVDMLLESHEAAAAAAMSAWMALAAAHDTERADHAEALGRWHDELADHGVTRSQLDAARHELGVERSRRAQLEDRLAALERGLEGMLASRSWRVTAPLRAAMRYARILRGERPPPQAPSDTVARTLPASGTSPAMSSRGRMVLHDLERLLAERTR